MAEKNEINEAELLEQIEAARARAAETDRTEPRAVSARYDAASGLVQVQMRNGLQVAFAPAMVSELDGATPGDLAQVGLTPFGDALACPPLDVHIHLAGLLADLTGLSAWWQREAVRRAGRATSDAKARAARVNGRKGGRPRKSAAPPQGETLHAPRRGGNVLREERAEYGKPPADEPSGSGDQ
jgi:hypothetical protein